MRSEPENAASVSAARDRLRTVGRWIGEWNRDAQSGHRIVCVFDTDVLTMYSRADRSASYCALLREEGASRRDLGRRSAERNGLLREAEVRLAEIIGNHIVWRRADPALNSPAHADELADVCNAVFGGAIAEVPALKDRLRECFHEVSLTADVGAIPEMRIDRILSDLSAKAPRVFEALRLEAAFASDRIFSVDAYAGGQKDPSAAGAVRMPSGFNVETGDFIDDILVLARQLETVLAARAHAGEFDSRRMRADARALAHLCWLNQQLEGECRNERVRFVTGAPQLHRLCDFPFAWEGQVPPRIKTTLEALVPELRALIRHPIAFVDDSLDIRLGAWLSDRLPDGTMDRADGMRLLHSAAEELADLLRAARAREAVSADWRWLQEVVADIEQAGDWNETLGRRLDALLPRFLASLAVLQRPSSRTDSVSRNLPPLVFSAFPACHRFCDQLYADHASKAIAADAAKARLAEVIESDSSLYTPLIAVALWRAADRDWHRVRVMSRAAVEIADQCVESRAREGNQERRARTTDAIYGEEALYLYAVATRLTAGSGHRKLDASADLQDALDALSRARKRVEQFRRSDGLKSLDRRFDSEEVSIQLTQILFARLGRQGDAVREHEKTLFEKTWEVLMAHLSDDAGRKQSLYQYEYVLQQLCVSMAQLVLLDRYAVSGNEVFPILAKTWSEQAPYVERILRLRDEFSLQCRRLKNAPRDPGSDVLPVASSFVTLVWLSFDLDVSEQIQEHEAQQLLNDLRACTSPRHHVAAIDEARFNFLSKIAQRRLGRL